MLLLFDIDGTLLIRGAREHAMALHDAIEEVWSVDLRDVRVETGGRTDPEIARDILVRGGVERARDRGAARAVPRVARRAATPSSCPDDLSERVAPGRARRARRRSARTRRCGSRS